ncbi:MAG: hypothetical protein Faunusvirus20_19, partial [Faunusvirus sp.]
MIVKMCNLIMLRYNGLCIINIYQFFSYGDFA